MNIVVAVLITVAVVALVRAVVWKLTDKKAQNYAVTLVRNEGSFIGLCIKKRWNTWTFVDIKIQPSNPGAPVAQAAPGELYVPYRNILYYQRIANVAE